MDWKKALGEDSQGSRPRSVLLTDGSREQVAERLARLVDRREVAFSPEDQWQPRGTSDVRETQLDKQLSDGAVLLSSTMRRQMKDWWLANDGRGRAKTPTWDIASTCTISGKTGLLLVEAKAHTGEMKENDRCYAKGDNLTQIQDALGTASAGLRKVMGGSWGLSTQHHYQLSNRFAWSWKLAMLGVPIVLFYLGFLDAREMQHSGDLFQSEDVWRDVMRDYCRSVVDESCWTRTLNVEGTPLMPMLGVFNQPFEP